MKNYTITVNGNVYDVVVEEGASVGAPAAAKAPAAPKAAMPPNLSRSRRVKLVAVMVTPSLSCGIRRAGASGAPMSPGRRIAIGPAKPPRAHRAPLSAARRSHEHRTPT